MSVFEFVSVDKFVVIAMDKRISIVIENATRHMVDVAPIIIARFVLLSRLEWSRLQVKDQNVATQSLLVTRILWQNNVTAIRLTDIRGGWRELQVGIEQSYHFADVDVGFGVGGGAVKYFVSWGSFRVLQSYAGGAVRCQCCVSLPTDRDSNLQISVRAAMKRHPGRSLPGHESKDKNQDKTSAHG